MSLIPRAQVIDAAWRALGEGVGELSSPDGGPLSRTVKLVLIPLVLRPTQNPALASPLLDPAGVAELTRQVNDHADRLRACAAWYTELRVARRRLRLVLGSPQDLYFPRGFELAAQYGPPTALDPATLTSAADEVVTGLDLALSARSPDAVRETLADPGRQAELTATLHEAWSRTPDETVPERIGDLTATVLDACPGPPNPEAENALATLVAVNAGRATGAALRVGGPWPEWVLTEESAHALGLTDRRLPEQPALEGNAEQRFNPPFDRPVAQRVIGVLQHSRDREALPPVAEMLADEAERTGQPWALFDESLRVTLVLGTTIAAGLQVPGGPPMPVTLRAQAAINARWRREASLAKAHRLTISPDPDAPPELLALARRLAEPWKHYLRRLWVRLHGADAQGVTPLRLDDTWDLLDGVARSVVLDHRSRVRAALTALATPNGPTPNEGPRI